MGKILNPSMNQDILDFDKHLKNGELLIINTAQGMLGDLSRILSCLIMLKLQTAILSRPGNITTRRANFVYINEFPTYINPQFIDMLIMGRSRQVGIHLSTQPGRFMRLNEGLDEIDFRYIISSNVRNVIIFPGTGDEQEEVLKYYAQEFEGLSKNDIMNRNFLEITHRIVVNNRLQSPNFGKLTLTSGEFLRKLENMAYDN